MSSGKPSLYEVENAFQPAKEISDIDRFAGRAKPVRDAFLALMAEGANIAIIGNRGIGISAGETTALSKSWPLASIIRMTTTLWHTA